MILREALVFPGILGSKKVCSMKPHAQLFYRNLMHACDGAGVFENDPKELCAYLYPTARDRVTKETVGRWLLECHQAGLITFHTDDNGRALGKFVTWLQRDTGRKRRYHNGETNPGELDELFTSDPEKTHSAELSKTATGPPSEVNRKGREGKGKAPEAPARPAAPAPASNDIETESDWRKRLVLAWPNVDLNRELTAAAEDRRKRGKKLERAWFERHWLPNWSPTVNLDAHPTAATAIDPEPEGWRVYLKDRYDGEDWAYTAGLMAWAALPVAYRKRIAREMKGAA